MSFRSGRKPNFVGFHAHVGIRTAQILDVFSRGNINQHYGDVVLDGVDPPADATFEALSVGIYNHRFLANRTDQNVEQVLRNHTDYIVMANW
jgi:hypothetical protein